MAPDFLNGAILALVSAALGFLGARSKSWVDRRRARKTLASGLLSELRWLDGILRQIVQHGPVSFYDPLGHPFIEAAISRLTLFDQPTAQRIAHFHAMLRDVRAGVNEYRVHPEAVAERREEYKRFLKSKASFAAQAIPALKDALLDAGGSLLASLYGEDHRGDRYPGASAVILRKVLGLFRVTSVINAA